MVIIPILPQAEFGPTDHREDAPHFIFSLKRVTCKTLGDISLEMKVFLGQISFVFVNNAECINIHSHQK